jgi:hypothetical protein
LMSEPTIVMGQGHLITAVLERCRAHQMHPREARLPGGGDPPLRTA